MLLVKTLQNILFTEFVSCILIFSEDLLQCRQNRVICVELVHWCIADLPLSNSYLLQHAKKTHTVYNSRGSEIFTAVDLLSFMFHASSYVSFCVFCFWILFTILFFISCFALRLTHLYAKCTYVQKMSATINNMCLLAAYRRQHTTLIILC